MRECILLFLLIILLSGCATKYVPEMYLPAPPERLLSEPKSFSHVPLTEENKLSEVLPYIIDNNTICIENTILLRAWITWYNQQKDLIKTK